MNPNQPQFELYWRKKISQEIAVYTLINGHLITDETGEVLDELREHVGTFIC